MAKWSEAPPVLSGKLSNDGPQVLSHEGKNFDVQKILLQTIEQKIFAPKTPMLFRPIFLRSQNRAAKYVKLELNPNMSPASLNLPDLTKSPWTAWPSHAGYFLGGNGL